jgi:hypothetical protein
MYGRACLLAGIQQLQVANSDFQDNRKQVKPVSDLTMNDSTVVQHPVGILAIVCKYQDQMDWSIELCTEERPVA